jgi:hypothetical protein
MSWRRVGLVLLILAGLGAAVLAAPFVYLSG